MDAKAFPPQDVVAEKQVFHSMMPVCEKVFSTAATKNEKKGLDKLSAYIL